MATFPQITTPPQNKAEVVVNEALETLEHQAVYGKRHATSTGLIWGYYGGRWGGFAVVAGTLALTLSATNYLVVAIATGVISVSTDPTNWNNGTNYVRAYKLTTSATAVTATEDHRAGPRGVHGGAGGTAGGTAGRHAIPVMAGSMRPSVTGGCAALAGIASAANQPDIVSLDFDTTTQEFAQFAVPMPKSWNEGTITFRPLWSHAATATNFGVVWALQAVAVSDLDPIAVAFGAAQPSVDTGGTTNALYAGPESAPITVAGLPVAEDTVFFRLSRVPADAGDTLAIDARLHGIVLYVTTDAETDA